MLRVAAVVLVGLFGLAGCGGGQDTPLPPKPTPIAKLDSSGLEIDRAPFCSRIPTAAVTQALDGARTSAASWRNGDKAEVEDSLDDVVHEFGCRFTRDDTTASAWVFAREVTAEQAARVVKSSSKRKGCTATPAATFGSPGVRQTCTLADGRQRVRLSGLFGSTWLACQLEAPTGVPATTLATRTDAWCVQVANAASKD